MASPLFLVTTAGNVRSSSSKRISSDYRKQWLACRAKVTKPFAHLQLQVLKAFFFKAYAILWHSLFGKINEFIKSLINFPQAPGHVPKITVNNDEHIVYLPSYLKHDNGSGSHFQHFSLLLCFTLHNLLAGRQIGLSFNYSPPCADTGSVYPNYDQMSHYSDWVCRNYDKTAHYQGTDYQWTCSNC